MPMVADVAACQVEIARLRDINAELQAALIAMVNVAAIAEATAPEDPGRLWSFVAVMRQVEAALVKAES